MLENHNIKYIFSEITESFTKILVTNENENYEKEFRNCFNQNCTFMKGDRLFRCPTAALIPIFVSKFGCDIEYGSGIKIDTITDGWKCLEELDKPDVLCKYCLASNMEAIPWCTTSNPILEDWIINQ